MSIIPVNDEPYDIDADFINIKVGGGNSSILKESSFEDPFSKNWDELSKLEGINSNFKRKTNRIAKSYTGLDDAKSKKLDPLDLTGYSLFQIVQPPYNLMYLAQLYDISPYHHAAVNAKAANVVGLGYHFEETQKVLDKIEDVIDDPKKLDKLRRKIMTAKGELRDYIESLNSDDSFLWIMKKIYIDLETCGNAYMEIGRTSSGRIGYVGHIPTITMRIRRHRDGFVQVVYNRYTYFRNFGDTTTQDQIGTDPQPNEVIHFKKYTPTNTYYGVPDILSAKNAVAGDEFASRFNLDYFENKAVPRYIITVKGAKLSADSERKLLEFFQTGLRGRNHRTLYIPLPSDGENSRVEFNMEPIEAGVQDSSFRNYAVENRDRILFADGVPISKIGAPNGVGNAAAMAADKTFKEQICRPAQDELERKINQLIREFTDAFDLRFDELTLTDELTQTKIDESMLRMQVVVPNEIRVKKGLSPRPGGDDPVMMNAQQNAEQSTQASGNRQRDQRRNMNASDTEGERNPQGEGRKVT
jgi:PBSX family phage portal protein